MNKILGIGSRINHPKYGKGVITNISTNDYWVTFIDTGIETIPLNDSFDIIQACENEIDLVSFYEVEKSLKQILRRWSDATERVSIADKWKGGVLILQPKEGQEKEIPIDTFFHKIVMVRDRIRVMEQKINSSKNLSDDEKVDLQQYITRIYGSLTTFNILFKLKEDVFVGEKTK